MFGISEFLTVKNLSEKQFLQIYELWNNEYPEQIRFKELDDFKLYLDGLENPIHTLIVNSSGIVLGWFVEFLRDEMFWFAMILNSSFQGKGFGSELLNRSKRNKIELNGWVVDHNNDKKRNGNVYNSPIEFYLKNGFRILVEERIENETLSAVKIQWKKLF